MTTEVAATTIVYPETDGMPLPDGETQSPIFVAIMGMLRGFFGKVRGARVNGDTFIYFIEGDNRRSVSPDCYVALGLSDESIASIEGRNSYLVWEVGKPPDFVLEIGSESTGRVDTGSKRDIYAEIGVPEYWRYDPTGRDYYGEPLVGERLVDGEYARLPLRYEEDGSIWSHSEALNLDLRWLDGELRFRDSVSGNWLLSYEEQQGRAEEAEARANLEAARAEEERAGRLTAEVRVAELEAELRRMQAD